MIWWWSSEESRSEPGEGETRDLRAAERVSEARFAWRLCSEMKVGMLRRPRRVSDLQFRSIFSSTFLSVARCWWYENDGKSRNTSTWLELLHALFHALQ